MNASASFHLPFLQYCPYLMDFINCMKSFESIADKLMVFLTKAGLTLINESNAFVEIRYESANF